MFLFKSKLPLNAATLLGRSLCLNIHHGKNRCLSSEATSRLETLVQDLIKSMNTRFSAMDDKFSAIDVKFSAMDAKLDGMNNRLAKVEYSTQMLRESSGRQKAEQHFGRLFCEAHKIQSLFDIVDLYAQGPLKQDQGRDKNISELVRLTSILEKRIQERRLLRKWWNRVISSVSQDIPDAKQFLLNGSTPNIPQDHVQALRKLVATSSQLPVKTKTSVFQRLDRLSHSHSPDFLRSSDGPGIMILTSEVTGEGIYAAQEMELDLRGSISLSSNTVNIKVGEIKSNPADFHSAQRQLARSLGVLKWCAKALVPKSSQVGLEGHIFMANTKGERESHLVKKIFGNEVSFFAHYF